MLILALDAALYPTLLAAVVILLSQPKRFELLSVYLFTGLGLSISVGLGIVLILHSSGVVKGGSSSGFSWTTDLAIGGLALLLAVALARRADVRLKRRREVRKEARERARGKTAVDEDKAEPWSQRILAKGSVPIVFVAALAINLPGAAYLVALKDIAAANHGVAGDLAWIVGFNVIMFLLAEIPWVGLVVAPARTQALVDRMNHVLTADGRRIAIVLCVVLGVYLIVRGIIHAT
ncbi:MAG TPA: GAP family protein [Solirubrobacteraceae bacterium]